MRSFGWRGRHWALTAGAAIAVACGSSESGSSNPNPEAGIADAATDASGNAESGGAPGAGGSAAGATPGAGGVVIPIGAGGIPTSAGAGNALGAGCALADAATTPPVENVPDASTRMDASIGEPRDAGTGDRDATGPRDAGPVTYPPLRVASIGRPTVVSNQFFFTEGPVWNAAEQALYFSDINGDAVYRLTLPDTFDVAVRHAGSPDGLGIDPSGRLVAAGFVSRDVWRLEGTKVHSLVSKYRGRALNSPDDLIVRSDGVIYFTDPTFGVDGSQGFSIQPTELCFQGVYRLTTDGQLFLEDEATAGPNGVELSPDESKLYVTYTTSGQVYSFRVAADGSLHDRALFATVLLADSTCIDAAGNLYVASLAGLTVLDRTGRSLGVIATQGQVPTNCTFGGPDQRTLFITARSGLAGTPAAGNSSLFRVDAMPIPGIPGRP